MDYNQVKAVFKGVEILYSTDEIFEGTTLIDRNAREEGATAEKAGAPWRKTF
jgi:hypothetical protein